MWTGAAFKTNPVEFVTGVVKGQYKPGADGGQVITLPELLGAGPGGIGGNYGSYATGFTDAVWKNLGGVQGLMMAVGKQAAVTAGFRIAKRLLRKPLGQANKALGAVGLGSTVRV